MATIPESEWKTRKTRIDPQLDAAGWRLSAPASGPHRTEEHPTDNGPADYALAAGDEVLGVVEAKKLSLGPQNVLTQAERYARGLTGNPFNYAGFHVPFLYATNGEVIWFHDVRHPLNLSRRVAAFHTPAALQEALGRDQDAAAARLLALPNTNARLRPYQRDANAAIEQAIADRKRSMLVAMATGTGKTFTMVNEVWRLLKSGVARRVLFLVDRRALAAQAVRAFASFETERGLRFPQTYEVYSNRFQKDDLDEDEKKDFDPTLIPEKYLTAPDPRKTFVYVCTIQRMAINVLGRQAIFGTGDEPVDEDATRLDIPIHAFDVIIADECHRGYTAQEESVWRDTLDHFDAVKIGLTATPAAHTTAYFHHLVYRYDYRQAVKDGFLVDYDAVAVHSEVRLKGVFLEEGEQVEVIDPETGASNRDTMEDERQYDAADVEQRITAPDSNRRILEEVRKYALEHELRTGRLPKTLIFAVHDIPHISHADQLVGLARDVYGRGESYVAKITGRVDRPLQRIREFRNRQNPGVVVTVDLLTTGVDIPDLEFLVLLRPVKSRILFEQMLGRGTRKGEKYPDKSHFVVFDCFEGTLLEYFKKTTGITAEKPVGPTRTLAEIIEDIWNNREREYNTGCLTKRLHRIDREIPGETRDRLARFVPNGDLGGFARGLPAALRKDFVGTMKTLRDPDFQALLTGYQRPKRVFVKADGVEDEVSSTWIIHDGEGADYKVGDYLQAFEAFVQEHKSDVEAIGILLDRPGDWSPAALSELNRRLKDHPLCFSLDRLQRVHAAHYKRDLVDIISMVKHAADGESPLLTAEERVERAFSRITAGRAFTTAQRAWLDRIREHLRQNLSIDRQDFEDIPVLSGAGGWEAAVSDFGADLSPLLHDLNEGLAA